MNACFRRRARRSTAWLCLAAAFATTGCAGSMHEAPAPGMDTMIHQEGAMPGGDALSPVAPSSPASPASSPAGSPAPNGAPSAPQPAADLATPTSPPASNSAHGAKEVQTKSASAGDVEQMIIFTGRLELTVAQERFAPTLHDVVELAAKRGGYIHQQSNESVTVRVPSARFRETLHTFEQLGEVTHRSVEAQDVSEKYFDLGVRLKSLHATRDRLEGFLGRAKTIEEVLRIEQELRRLNAEIDQLEGQRRFLSAQAAYSTITVALRAKPKPQVIVDEVEEEAPPPPPPPPKTLVLPIEWFGDVSLDRLLQLEEE